MFLRTPYIKILFLSSVLVLWGCPLDDDDDDDSGMPAEEQTQDQGSDSDDQSTDDDSTGDGSDQPAAMSGIFLDSAVEGLQYRTATMEGITDSDGRFEFLEGETVEFYVGGIVIGSATGDTVITPLDLVEGARLATDDEVVNIIRFLQTLDDDGDPDNGILISEQVRVSAANYSVQFNVTATEFESDDNVITTIISLTSISTAGERTLVSYVEAVNHFQFTINDLNGDAQVGGRELTLEELNALLLEPAVWRSSGEWQIDIVNETTALGETITTTSSGTFKSANVLSIEPKANNLFDIDYCDLREEDLSFDEVVDTDEDDSAFCADNSVYEVRYFEVNAINYEARIYCDDEFIGSYDIAKLSDDARFNLGSLSLDGSDINNVNANSDVCGSIFVSDSDIVVEPQPNGFGLESFELKDTNISVTAYVGNQPVTMNMSFATAELTAGSYEIANDVDGNSVYISGLDGTGVGNIFTGTVVIESVTDLSASGNFQLTDISNEFGDVSGNFQLDLN